MKPPLGGGTYLCRLVRYALDSREIPASREGQLFSSVLWSGPTDHPEPALVAGDRSWDTLLEDTSTCFFQVRKQGKVVYNWRSTRETGERPCKAYSLTKSLFSLAWGAAQDRGLPPLDTRLGEALPGRRLHPAVARFTLEELFLMTSGLKFDGRFLPWSEQTRTYLTPDARHTAWAARPDRSESPHFHYNDLATLLLGTVMESALGRSGNSGSPSPLSRFFFEGLAQPLGLKGPVLFNLDSDSKAFPKVESGLNLTVSDLARWGELVLNRGQIGKKRLVSDAWIDQSTGRDGSWQKKGDFWRYQKSRWGSWLAEGNGYYKYHWWGFKNEQAFFALGIRGQILLICPQDGTVAVRLADRWALDGWWPQRMLEFTRSLG